MKSVYLFGPVVGLTFEDAQTWRKWMTEELGPRGIEVINPLRFNDFLAGTGRISSHGRDCADLHALATPSAIFARDKFDVLRADMLLGNFLGATRVGIGSMFEQAWAHLHHKPIAMAIESEGNLHDHIFVNESVDFRVESLVALRDVAIAVLG